MPNFTVLQNPQVSGNISSCKTEVSVVQEAERLNFFIVNDVGYATNNCTGETERLSEWHFSSESKQLFGTLSTIFTVLIIGLLGFLFIKKLLK